MNPASRLVSIYDDLIVNRPDRSMLEVWTDVFHLDPSSPDREDQVTACLMALRQQVDLVRGRLDAHGVPTDLTHPGFVRMKDVAAPSQLNAGWNGVRGNIAAPECRHAFTWSSWVLRNEEEGDISAEELSSLKEELDALEASLAGARLPEYLHDFILRQVRVIRAALQLYDIQGGRPLQEAMRSVVGDLAVTGSVVRNATEDVSDDGKKALARASQLIKKVAEVSDSFDKIRKCGIGVGEVAANLGPHIVRLIECLTK